MPEYLAPGVYVEEINTGPRPIEGVSTSTAGFAGETERGSTKPTLVTSWADFQRNFGGYIDEEPRETDNVYLPYAIRGFFENGGQRAYVARVVGSPRPPPNAPPPAPNAPKPPAVAAAATLASDPANPQKPTIVEAIGPGKWGNNLRITISAASASATLPKLASGQVDKNPVRSWFRLQVLYYRNPFPDPLFDPKIPGRFARPPDAFEDFDNLSPDSTRPNFALSAINGSSSLIKLTACPARPADVADFKVELKGGNAGPATVGDFTESNLDPELRTGLEGLLAIRDVSLMACPDEVVLANLSDELLNRCEGAKDRFAILNEITDKSDYGAIVQHRDSSYGGLYYPRLRVVAPHTPEGYAIVPPAGHVAGIFARTDVGRGVHKAPANEVVRGILSRDLVGGRKPLSHTLTKREHDMLNPRGVNVIRDFRPDGRDIRVWGARTMTSDAMWKYINVRRLFIFIEQSIDRGTQWAVFEPNSEITWISMRASITNFLRTVWNNGALMGTIQEEAFFVKCDRTTMTQDDFDNGRLICLIGIAPVKPAEFVIIRISQKTLEAES